MLSPHASDLLAEISKYEKELVCEKAFDYFEVLCSSSCCRNEVRLFLEVLLPKIIKINSKFGKAILEKASDLNTLPQLQMVISGIGFNLKPSAL